MKYRKKPVVIEAWKVEDLVDAAIHHWAKLPEPVRAKYKEGKILFIPCGVEVLTLEGNMKADIGDFLIMGVKGELYPCKPDIFAATYEEV